MTVNLFSVPSFDVLHHILGMLDENQKYFTVTQLNIVFDFSGDFGCNSYKSQAYVKGCEFLMWV